MECDILCFDMFCFLKYLTICKILVCLNRKGGNTDCKAECGKDSSKAFSSSVSHLSALFCHDFGIFTPVQMSTYENDSNCWLPCLSVWKFGDQGLDRSVCAGIQEKASCVPENSACLCPSCMEMARTEPQAEPVLPGTGSAGGDIPLGDLSSFPASLAQEGWLLLSGSKAEQSSFFLILFLWLFLQLFGNGWFDTSKWKSNCKLDRRRQLKLFSLHAVPSHKYLGEVRGMHAWWGMGRKKYETWTCFILCFV